MRIPWARIAVLIPIVGLLVLVGKAEFAAHSGPTWHIPIEGYDPRDLLHGRYLQYQFRFNWQGKSDCGGQVTVGQPVLDPDCCLCLTRTNELGIDPAVRQVSCDEAERCDGWLRTEAVEPPLRYFVPEDRAPALEEALFEREASLELRCGPNGTPAIIELSKAGSSSGSPELILLTAFLNSTLNSP